MRWIPMILAAWSLLPFPIAVGVGRMFHASEDDAAQIAESIDRW